MKKQSMQISVKTLAKMMSNGELSPSVFQRASGQWGGYEQSLLFNSMVNDYIIPPLYFAKTLVGADEKGRPIYKTEIVDGLQRVSTCVAFLNDEFALDEKTPAVVTDDETVVEIAGKLYSELPQEVQDSIRTFLFTAYNLENFTDEEIEEVFFRLNNGVALTKGQQSKAKMGSELAAFINEMLNKPFYQKAVHFTAAQKRRANDQLTLIQAMALLDNRYDGYELKSISENDMFNYAVSLRNNYSQAKRDRLEAILDYLEIFEDEDKMIKKVNIPMIILTADMAIRWKVHPVDFLNWWNEFAENYKPSCEYASYCSSGSVKKEKTMKRVELMEASLLEYVESLEDDDFGTAADDDASEDEEVVVVSVEEEPEMVTAEEPEMAQDDETAQEEMETPETEEPINEETVNEEPVMNEPETVEETAAEDEMAHDAEGNEEAPEDGIEPDVAC